MLGKWGGQHVLWFYEPSWESIFLYNSTIIFLICYISLLGTPRAWSLFSLDLSTLDDYYVLGGHELSVHGPLTFWW